jgi:type 1 fimbria pilin
MIKEHNMNSKNLPLSGAALALSLWALGNGVAQANVPINITGTLIQAPNCTVSSSSGTSIGVPLGDVMSNLIDGVNYKKVELGYNLTCTPAGTHQVQLRVNGTSAGTSYPHVLTSSRTGLGIGLYNGSTAQNINTWFNASSSSKPRLYVVPVKTIAGELTGGSISATATLLVQLP